MEVQYGEGIYVGYRYYEKKQLDVMYPFGFGLSYTQFEITNLQVPACVNCEQQDVELRVTVRNTGNMAGAEVVQLYVRDVVSTLDKPLKELKAFRKVFLRPGETKEISLCLSKRDFASYDPRLKRWATEPGKFELLVGNASDHILETAELELICENPYGIGPHTNIAQVVSNPAALAIVDAAIGDSLMRVSGSYIVFQPRTSFEEIWELCVVPTLHLNAARSDALQQDIYRQWKRLK